jgi:hypothetical protein
LLHALETELDSARLCLVALECQPQPRVRREWEGRLHEAEARARSLRCVCAALGVDPDEETLARSLVRHIGRAFERAVRVALARRDQRTARLLATDAVLGSSLKALENWELLGEIATRLPGIPGAELRAAHAAVEAQRHGHLYHTRARHFWTEALALCPVPAASEVTRAPIAAAAAG